MENTCCEGKCPFVKTGFCNSVDECPNFVESWWTNAAEPEPKLVRDCAPKRLMKQMAQLQCRLEGVQLANEQARNQSLVIHGHFADLMAEIQKAKEIHELSLKDKNKPSIEYINDQNKEI